MNYFVKSIYLLYRPNPDSSVASESFLHLPGNDNSLSQHPLLQDSVRSEEEQMSSGLLSQHSFLLATDKSREKQPSDEEDIDEIRERISSPLQKTQDKLVVDDEALPPTKHLPELLQENVDPILPSSSKVMVSTTKAPDGLQALQPNDQPDREVHTNQSVTASDESLNVSVGPCSSQSDEGRELLLQDVQSESQKSQQRIGPSSHSQPTEVAGRLHPTEHPSLAGPNREPDLWSLASQVGLDGSDMGFLPRAQSTPGVSTALLPTSSSKDPAGPSTIQSNQTETGAATPAPITSCPDQEKEEEGRPSSQVQSLPSISFKQKVDAWRANQGSTSVSLYDTLALQGFSGVPPRQKAFDAVSDTLNGILSLKLDSFKQTLAAEHSSPEIEEEADERNMGSAPRPSASTHLDSQSHMSLDMHENAPTDPQGDIHQQQPDPRAGPSTPQTLNQFSDASPNLDSTLSFSQSSHSTEVNIEERIPVRDQSFYDLGICAHFVCPDAFCPILEHSCISTTWALTSRQPLSSIRLLPRVQLESLNSLLLIFSRSKDRSERQPGAASPLKVPTL